MPNQAVVPTQSHNQSSPSHPPSDAFHGESKVSHGTEATNGQSSSTNRRAAATTRTVPKPVPESQRIDPRQFQLNQLRRRFSPREKEDREATVLTFSLTPTDPDFPFEMTALQCTLAIPHSYPSKALPWLRVTNPEMDRGYQINIERGFDSLVTAMSSSTLLGVFNELDKRLEGFLVSEKAHTIKLVANTGKKTSDVASTASTMPATSVAVSAAMESPLMASQPHYSPQQIAEARTKRESDVRQLEARMGRQSLFSKSSDGLSFTVPLQIPKSSKLPKSLQSVQSVRLIVPLLYNLEPCSVLIEVAPSVETDAVQVAFERHCRAHPELTLMALVNHLAQNMHTMAMERSDPVPETPSLPSPIVEMALQTSKDAAQDLLDDRSHIHIIPQPPEWDNPRDDDSSDSSEGYDSQADSEDATDKDGGGAVIPPEAQPSLDPGPDLGILLSFPSLELYGAELLQLYSVSVTIKCDRCKDMKDVKNVRSHAQGDQILVRHESCNKCANQLSIGWRSPRFDGFAHTDDY